MPEKNAEIDLLQLTQSIGLLVRRMRAAAAAHELSLSESSVLARLDREGPETTAALARAEGVRPQSMGATVAALEERGLVVRKPHPSDRRQVFIALTGKGAAVRMSARGAKHAWLAEAVAQLDSGERKTLFAAGKIFQRLAEIDLLRDNQ